MTMYRKKATQTIAPQDAATAATGTSQVRLHSTLATCLYGLESIRVRAPPQSTPQAVEQEFNAYALTTPSPEGTRPLAF